MCGRYQLNPWKFKHFKLFRLIIFSQCLCFSLGFSCEEFGDPNKNIHDINKAVKLIRKKHPEANGRKCEVDWQVFLLYSELAKTTLCGHIGRTNEKNRQQLLKAKQKLTELMQLCPELGEIKGLGNLG